LSFKIKTQAKGTKTNKNNLDIAISRQLSENTFASNHLAWHLPIYFYQGAV
jgi:hypothetical protein